MKCEIFGKIVASALYKNHIIYTGRNHAECFTKAPKGYLRDAEQGFLSENGMFLNRKDALVVAKYYKQIREKHSPYDELCSEDLLDI